MITKKVCNTKQACQSTILHKKSENATAGFGHA
jgi:hypothetical protein